MIEFKKSIFVVMPFGKESNIAYRNANAAYENVVKPLCEEMGFDVVRADNIASTAVVYDDILQGIRNSDIVIADISGQNPNVMYELGIAHSLRQQTTIVITQDNVSNSPFDIKHFRIISYENSMQGSNTLKNKLRSVIESIQGNHKLISRREFEYCFGLFDAMGKRNEFVLLVGIKNSSISIERDSFLFWNVSHNGNSTGCGSRYGTDSFNPFLALECVALVNGEFAITAKGTAFSEMLEDLGYSCEISTDKDKGMDMFRDKQQEMMRQMNPLWQPANYPLTDTDK